MDTIIVRGSIRDDTGVYLVMKYGGCKSKQDRGETEERQAELRCER